VGFAGDSGFQVCVSGTDGQTGSGITDLFEVFQMTMGMTGFAFTSESKNRRDIGITLYISLSGKIQAVD